MKRLLIAILLAGPIGCASVKKATYDESTNPQDETTRLDQDIKQGYSDHLDVLDKKDFDEAQSYLKDAKKEIANNRKKSTILDSLGYSRAYLDRAKEKGDKVRAQAKDILDARADALEAGAHNYPAAAKQLKGADDEFRAEVDDLASGRTTTSRWASLQKTYLDIQRTALQDGSLGDSRARIDGAIAHGARKNTPNALQQAQRDVASAMNVIATNRNDQVLVKEAIDKADQSSQMLVDTLAQTKRPDGKVINEDAAKDFVLQGRKANSPEVALDKALESARKEFTSDEADVYRQGDQLLIRLKSVDFPVGRADLPPQSLALLAKVRSVAQQLKPSEITVEGHTDSTGTKEKNQVLSQNRADAVATYLGENGLPKEKITTQGYGFEKPLSTNKSKEGRAQNRRVDVILKM